MPSAVAERTDYVRGCQQADARDCPDASGAGGGNPDQVNFILSDAMQWEAPALSADLLVTHFFLDCFRAEQLEILIARLARAATQGAAWLLADFQEPPRGPARWRARAVLKLMYLFFRAATRLPARRLTSPDELLKRHGFELRARRETNWRLLRSDFWIRRGPVLGGNNHCFQAQIA